MKTKLLALALGMGLLAGAAHAVPTLSFSNVPAGWNGSYSIKLTGFEAFASSTGVVRAPGAAPQVGDVNFGVLRVTSITVNDGPGTGTTIWTDGDGGAEIMGVFSGITISAFAPPSVIDIDGPGPMPPVPVAGALLATGGLADFYINSAGSFNSVNVNGGFAQGIGGYAAELGGTCDLNENCYHGISDQGGGLLLSTEYVPGVLSNVGDNTTTVYGTINPNALLSGTANGFLKVTGGSDQDRFDTNGYLGGSADMNANNTFCSVTEAGCVDSGVGYGDWTTKINDPVVGTVKLPEPASLGLVGAALLGLGMVRRRKSA